MKRVCALDLGDVRVGVAMPDELGMYAHARSFIEAKPKDRMLAAIVELVKEEKITRFVIGLPLDMRGGEGEACRKVRLVAQEISDATGIEIELWDERLTTTQAHRELGASGIKARDRKGRVDAVAAVKILEAWMERERSGSGDE